VPLELADAVPVTEVVAERFCTNMPTFGDVATVTLEVHDPVPVIVRLVEPIPHPPTPREVDCESVPEALVESEVALLNVRPAGEAIG